MGVLLRGIDADPLFVPTGPFKSDKARNLGKQGVVLTDADIRAGMNPGTPLANQDIACQNMLPAKTLHAETL